MNDSFESDERKRKETIECLYWSLMNGWDIPKEIREYYGFSEDYELYHQLESMDPAEYRLKRLECEVPDIVELDAQLKHTVENIFERPRILTISLYSGISLSDMALTDIPLMQSKRNRLRRHVKNLTQDLTD